MNILIIVAGGKGLRAGLGYNKIFAKLNGDSILSLNLKTIEKAEVIDSVIISAKKADIPKINKIVKENKFKKILKIITSSKSRQSSTYKALKWLEKAKIKAQLVGVHNAVNPFVTRNEINQVFLEAAKHGAALLAYPARDTVKISNTKGLVDYTPVREKSWYAQTPQVGRFNDLYKAFKKAEKQGFSGTDDTQLLEKLGIPVKIVACSYQNLKITFPEDLVIAKILKKLVS
ncbi:MAG: IspD/TarI family cytidylyltransferase [Patescibacteria group bacterium]